MRSDIPFKTIDRVNSAIDNPNKAMIAIQQSGMFNSKELDTFKLRSHGHRKFNHSPMSAFMSAYMIDPKNAMDLAMMHLTLDKLSNYMVDTVGINERDLWEANFNKFVDLYRQTHMGYAPRKKKMFF